MFQKFRSLFVAGISLLSISNGAVSFNNHINIFFANKNRRHRNQSRPSSIRPIIMIPSQRRIITHTPNTVTTTSVIMKISGGGSSEEDSIHCQDPTPVTSSSSSSTTPTTSSDEIKGRTILCIVALLYGTLNVSLRLLYQLPTPPTASVLSTTRGMLACIGFIPLLFIRRNRIVIKDNENDSATTTTTTTTKIQQQTSSFVIAGFELAVWNFLAQGLLNVGLLSTTSARASFLTQLSVVITPIISFSFGQPIPKKVWLACIVALSGLTILSSASSANAVLTTVSSSTLIQFTSGDWLVLGGAISWSLYLYRLSKLSPKFDEINLQFVKTTVLAILYGIWFVTVTLGAGVEEPFSWISTMTIVKQSLFGWIGTITAFLILCYSAIGPGTVADVLQQQGQKYVSPSEANVILSMEPVFTALCAWFILGEITTIQEGIGGFIILLAALLATR